MLGVLCVSAVKLWAANHRSGAEYAEIASRQN